MPKYDQSLGEWELFSSGSSLLSGYWVQISINSGCLPLGSSKDLGGAVNGEEKKWNRTAFAYPVFPQCMRWALGKTREPLGCWCWKALAVTWAHHLEALICFTSPGHSAKHHCTLQKIPKWGFLIFRQLFLPFSYLSLWQKYQMTSEFSGRKENVWDLALALLLGRTLGLSSIPLRVRGFCQKWRCHCLCKGGCWDHGLTAQPLLPHAWDDCLA